MLNLQVIGRARQLWRCSARSAALLSALSTEPGNAVIVLQKSEVGQSLPIEAEVWLVKQTQQGVSLLVRSGGFGPVEQLAPSVLRQAATFRGSVRDDSANRPLAGVEVVIEGANRQTVTDAGGLFHFDSLPLGPHVALFRLLGYRPVRIRVNLVEGDSAPVDVRMVRQGVQQLDPVAVTARPAGPRGIGREAFEERRSRGFGKFIDSVELRRSDLRRLSDVLRSVPGLRMVRYQECSDPRRTRCGPIELRAAGGRGVTSMLGRNEDCWMSVLLNGSPIYSSSDHRPPPDFSRDFQVQELEAIEVYRSSAETPTEYSGTAAQCGVILLWTRQ